MPFIINSIYTNGIVFTIVNNNLVPKLYKTGIVFAHSKIVELGDTYFIAIRGKKIRFIQYMHHWVIMLYCWYVHSYIGIDNLPNNVNAIFCSMNYTVHSFMYTWYSTSALRNKNTKLDKEFNNINANNASVHRCICNHDSKYIREMVFNRFLWIFVCNMDVFILLLCFF